MISDTGSATALGPTRRRAWRGDGNWVTSIALPVYRARFPPLPLQKAEGSGLHVFGNLALRNSWELRPSFGALSTTSGGCLPSGVWLSPSVDHDTAPCGNPCGALRRCCIGVGHPVVLVADTLNVVALVDPTAQASSVSRSRRLLSLRRYFPWVTYRNS
jgi:hypothetical protein